MNLKSCCKTTAVVVRTYNNELIRKQVRRFLDFGYEHIFVVVNVKEDRGSTSSRGGYLREYWEDHRIIILEVYEGYSWSTALNQALIPIQFIASAAKAQNQPGIEFVFNCSVEALFEESHLSAMYSAIASSDIGVVGTTFDGRSQGNPVELGASYGHGRNTGLLIKLSTIKEVGFFDSWCDQNHGQEDMDFILRMHIVSNLRAVILDLKVPLLLKHYDPTVKQANEREALRRIVRRFRSYFPAGSELASRIENAIDRYGIRSVLEE